jgi:hypothetical protein
MSALVHQVSNFVQACEALHWGLLEGHSLSIEERDIIPQTAAELLMRAVATQMHLVGPHTT